MSYNMVVKMSLSCSHVQDLARQFSLPSPVHDGREGVYFLTASEVRDWVWFEPPEPHLGLYFAQRLMAEHATRHISNATNDADALERRGKVRTSHWDRKGFLRKATREYRLAFA